MTLPPIIRIFFAIELPSAVKTQVGNLISNLKKKAKTKAIRWAKPENLHITLQFLPEVRANDIERLIKEVRSKLENFSVSTRVDLENLQIFPNPFRPRVIVLTVTQQSFLAELSALIGRGIVNAAYEIENRPFKAHLTLGRIKHVQDTNLSFLNECKPQAITGMEIGEVVLFRSEPRPDGSSYIPMERIILSHATKRF